MLNTLELLVDTAEGVVTNPNSSLDEWESSINIMDDIIKNAIDVKSMIIDKIKELKYGHLVDDCNSDLYNTVYSPIFYTTDEVSHIENKFIAEKFGGDPFMTKKEKWPMGRDGRRLIFLCQIMKDTNILYRIFVNNISDNEYKLLPIKLDKKNISKQAKPTLVSDEPVFYIKQWAQYREIKMYKEIEEYISEKKYDSIINIHKPTNDVDYTIKIEKSYILQLIENDMYSNKLHFGDGGIYTFYEDEYLYFIC